MRVVGNQPAVRFKSINEVIEEVRAILRDGKRRVEDDPQLLRVIERLGIRVDSIKNMTDLVEKLERLKATTEEEVLNEKIAEAVVTPEEDLENARVPTAKIKELVEEYERHLEEGLTHEEAVARVSRDNKGLVARKNVEVFLERQREFFKETVQNLETGAKLQGQEAERTARVAATEQLLVEQKLAAVGVEQVQAEKIAKEMVEKVVLKGVVFERDPGVLDEITEEISGETVRQYAKEVVREGAENVDSQIEVGRKVGRIVETLVGSLGATSPDEVAREKVVLEMIVEESIQGQIKGEVRLEEPTITDQEMKEHQQQSPQKLSEQIVEALDLPPSKNAVIERAISEANTEIREWSDDKTKETVEAIVDDLEKASGEIAAVVKVKRDEIVRVATKEIQRAVSEGTGFEQVTEKVAEIIDPDLGKRVVVEMAVEKAEAEGKWSDQRIEKVVDRLVEELGPEAATKRAEIVVAVSEQVRPQSDKERGFSGLSEKVAVITGTPESKIEPIVKAVAAAEAEGKKWGAAKTDQAINKLVSTLKTDDDIAAKLASGSREAQFREVVRTKIEEAVSGEVNLEESAEKSPVPKNLNQRIAEMLNIPPEKRFAINQAIKSAGLEIDKLVSTENERVIKIRAEHVRNEIERGFTTTNERLSPDQIIKIHNYSDFVSRFFAESEQGMTAYKKEAVNFSENRGNSPGVINKAWSEVTGLSKIIQMKPKEFKEFREKYFQLREGVQGLKMPFQVPELRSLDGLMRLTQEIPQIQNLLTFTQRFTNLYSSVNGLTGGFLQKIGLEKAGTALLEKIGGQAMGEFAKHSLAVIAEHGTQKGVMMILNGILGGGVQAGAVGGAGAAAGAGATAAGSGALAGAVAAFQAIPVVGQVVLVAAAVLLVAAKVVKPIFEKAKKFLKGFTDALGIDMSAFQLGTKKFLQDNFGKLAGGVMDFGLKVGMFIVGIPTILAGITILTSPIAWIFVAMFGMGLITSLNVSAMVPRGPPSGVEIYDYGDEVAEPFDPGQPLPTRDPSIVFPESCPGIWPTNSGVITQGPLGSWSHRNAQAIDIGVGSVPIYATHDGQAVSGGSRDSTYGYYVEVRGNCNGRAITTRYAHMPNLLFTGTKMVKQGDLIGYVDNTGNSTGSHLHYELIGGQINDWLPKPVPLRCSEVYECNVSIP